MKMKTILLSGAVAFASTGFAWSQDTEIHMINCGAIADQGTSVQAEHVALWEAANPGFKVNVEYVPWGQCESKSTTLAGAGDPPAIAYIGSRGLKQLSQNELIIPVALTDDEKATYAAPILGTVTADGQQWGLPRAFSTKALYWNKDLFAAAGLPDAAPKTWDEMVAAAAAIQEKTDADGFGMIAADFDNTMHEFLNYVYTNGGAVLNDAGENVFNSPNNVQAMELYVKLAPLSQPGPTAYDREKLNPLFAESQIGMYVSGPWARGLVGDVNWGVAPIPVGPMGQPGTLLITDSLAVFKGSGVEDQALSLAKFLTNPDNQFAFEVASGFTPLRKVAGVADLVTADPTWAAFLDAIPTGGPEPLVTDYVGLQDAFTAGIQGVVLGELAPADAVAQIAAAIDGVM